MKEIKLFVDFEFTSLSPDAQQISVGIVSEEYFNEQYRQLYTDKVEIKKGNCSIDHLTTKSFYAEFSDFDINRCDNWVLENVVGKLLFKEDIFRHCTDDLKRIKGTSHEIKHSLKNWLEQFSDYQITFVVDCGTWDWYHLLQLIAEWEMSKFCACKNIGKCQVKLGFLDKCPNKLILIHWDAEKEFECEAMFNMKFGLPILPSNISPVPFELNQFIAEKKGISVREAFDLNREELAYAENYKVMNSKVPVVSYKKGGIQFMDGELNRNKHNALWDAKVMKAIYEKLIV